VAGQDQSAADQPNNLAEGHPTFNRCNHWLQKRQGCMLQCSVTVLMPLILKQPWLEEMQGCMLQCSVTVLMPLILKQPWLEEMQGCMLQCSVTVLMPISSKAALNTKDTRIILQRIAVIMPLTHMVYPKKRTGCQ